MWQYSASLISYNNNIVPPSYHITDASWSILLAIMLIQGCEGLRAAAHHHKMIIPRYVVWIHVRCAGHRSPNTLNGNCSRAITHSCTLGLSGEICIGIGMETWYGMHAWPPDARLLLGRTSEPSTLGHTLLLWKLYAESHVRCGAVITLNHS